MPDTPPLPGVLILQGWPRGFCPIHVMGPFRCDRFCADARVQFARAAAELDRYWHSQHEFSEVDRAIREMRVA